MLEEGNIAGHQGRRGEAKYLPKRKIPRHDGQNRAERLVADVAAAGSGLYRFVRQITFSILGIVPASPRALRGLVHRGAV